VDVLSPTTIQNLIQAYGLWVLFTVVMLESMGIPMPGETALVTAALYAGSTHQIGIASVVLVAAMAAIIGDNIGYLIGRSIGIRLVARYGGYVRLNAPRLKVGQYLFLRHGGGAARGDSLSGALVATRLLTVEAKRRIVTAVTACAVTLCNRSGIS